MTKEPWPEKELMLSLLLISCLLIVSWMISGCASPVQPREAKIPPLAPTELTELCGSARELPGPGFDVVYREYLTLLSDYRVCRLRHAGLVDWARSLQDED